MQELEDSLGAARATLQGSLSRTNAAAEAKARGKGLAEREADKALTSRRGRTEPNPCSRRGSSTSMASRMMRRVELLKKEELVEARGEASRAPGCAAFRA